MVCLYEIPSAYDTTWLRKKLYRGATSVHDSASIEGLLGHMVWQCAATAHDFAFAKGCSGRMVQRQCTTLPLQRGTWGRWSHGTRRQHATLQRGTRDEWSDSARWQWREAKPMRKKENPWCARVHSGQLVFNVEILPESVRKKDSGGSRRLRMRPPSWTRRFPNASAGDHRVRHANGISNELNK